MTRYRQLLVLIIALLAIAGYVLATHKMEGGLDLAGGMRVVYEVKPEKGQTFSKKDLPNIVRIIQRRVDARGVKERTVQPKGDNQIIVEISNVKGKTQQEIANELIKPTKLEFRHFNKVKSDANPGAPYSMNFSTEDGVQVYTFAGPQGEEIPADKVVEESPLILSGADLKDNSRADLGNVQSVVRIEFKAEGKKKFAEFTRRHVGEHLAIVLNGEILSAPVINEAILGGQAEISGNFTAKSAQALAEDLNSGALPVPLEIVEQNMVEATLGRQYVDQSIQAGLWGLGLVALFMLLYYLLPGFIAVVALCMYAAFTFAIYEGLSVTMTLPGLAGFILSIGMAVDANILIFERMKEELRGGKTLHAAIDAGFNRAWTAILDSNVCTLITCAILLSLTTGTVRGFAMTLGIGVLVSMFTAITVSRTLLHLITNSGFAQNTRLYALQRQTGIGTDKKHFEVIGRTPVWFSISGAFIVAGIFFLATNGLQRGIEFTGGTMMQVSFPQAVTAPQVTSAIREAGIESSQVQISREAGKYSAFVRTRQLKSNQVDQLREAIGDKLPGSSIVSTSFVGPSISKEITQKAVYAVVLASLLICVYLSLRFAQQGFGQGFRYGACALLALIHDVVVVLGASALFGKLYGWEIDGSFVTAMLTIIGFSVHDTIVVFDRIRENLRLKLRGESFDQLVNRSILQTFARSINTSLTLVLVLVTLLLFGGGAIKHFNAVMLVGVCFGTYSSIFVASPLLVLWDRMARRQSGKAIEMKPLVTPAPSVGNAVLDNGSESDGTDRGEQKAKPKAPAKRKKRRF